MRIDKFIARESIIFFSTSDVIGLINSRRMRWPGHVARVGGDECVCGSKLSSKASTWEA
jgi:hypothetical protein